MKIIVFLIPVFISNISFCQNELNDKLKLIMGISHYRTELLHRNINDLDSLKSIIEKVDTCKIKPEDKFNFIYSIYYSLRVGNYSYKLAKKIISRNIGSPEVIKNFSNGELDLISRNAEIFSLANMDIIEFFPPFKIYNKSSILDELAFYNIEEGDRIGEIGAGSGTIGILLGVIFNKLTIYLNEIDHELIKYIDEQLKNCYTINKGNYFETVLGNKHKSHLEGLDLDKIIMRNTFHHFKKPAKMVESIKNSLSENGEVFLLESIRTPLNAHSNSICEDAKEKNEILKIMQSQGFKLESEKEIADQLIMKFRLDFSK